MRHATSASTHVFSRPRRNKATCVSAYLEGGMAERLGRGLQIRLQRFNSASHLHFHPIENMITVWGLILGIPLLAFGGGSLLLSGKTSRFIDWFENSRVVAALLTVVACLWTVYECDTIGIDVF